MLAAQFMMMLHVLIISSKLWGENPTFYFYKSPSLFYDGKIHWSYFFFDKIVEVVAVLVPDTIETRAADDLLFESLVEIHSLFASDEDINDLDFGEWKKKLF